MAAACRTAERVYQVLLLSLVCLTANASADSVPDLTLRSTIRGDQNRSYVELPFDVPSGVTRISVIVSYTGKDQRTTIDLGIADPQRFRGWSGGNKDSFTLSSEDATPSYLPGAIVPGRWKLWLGVPNIRPASTSVVEAKIYFTREPSGPHGFTDQPLETKSRWYRGDLHMHTAHSDGRCASQSGKEVPCPVFLTIQAAASRGLDFVAITDHNTTSHFNSMRELQPYFDRLLLIPGREVTTFQGHANVFGITEFLDFRVSNEALDMNAVLQDVGRKGALISINHPALPSGESCMGCGWNPEPSADMNLVQAVEAINGGVPEGPFAGVSFWEEQLRQGLRPTAVGGSDNHRPQLPLDKSGSIGTPTTVVYAPELSVPAILEGIRAGHVFIDLTGSRERLLEFSARLGSGSATFGDALPAPNGATIQLTIRVVACPGSSLRFVLDGHSDSSLPLTTLSQSDASLTFSWTSDGKKHWLRPDVTASDGKLQLLGNPIYINYTSR